MSEQRKVKKTVDSRPMVHYKGRRIQFMSEGELKKRIFKTVTEGKHKGGRYLSSELLTGQAHKRKEVSA